jgi:multiple sugar transport system permease protein
MAVGSTAQIKPAARRKRRNWRRVLLWIVLGLGAVFMVAPFYWTIVTSFKSREEVMLFPPTFWPMKPTLEHWIGLTNLRFGSFALFFRNSAFISFTVTALILLTSALCGYVFSKHHFRGRDALFVGILCMLMIPFNISIIPLYAMMVDLKWTNTYWPLIIPSIYSPFGIFLMRQFIQTIPDELIDAARIDGASEFGIFFRVIVPLSTAALGALAIFTFIGQWDDFLWPLVIIDESRLYTLPLALARFRGRTTTDVGGLAAASLVAVIPVLVVYFFAQRRFIEGIAMTGIKG